MMRRLRNGTTLPTVIRGDWVMHNGGVLYGCVQNYWCELIACKGQGISPFVVLFPALVDCRLMVIVRVHDEMYFMTKKYTYMWDMRETQRTNFRRYTHKNSHKNDIFLYAYKNIHVYMNFRRHPLCHTYFRCWHLLSIVLISAQELMYTYLPRFTIIPANGLQYFGRIVFFFHKLSMYTRNLLSPLYSAQWPCNF